MAKTTRRRLKTGGYAVLIGKELIGEIHRHPLGHWAVLVVRDGQLVPPGEPCNHPRRTLALASRFIRSRRDQLLAIAARAALEAAR